VAEQLVGEQLDRLGVTLDIGEGQQITEVVVVAKLADFTIGGTAITIGTTPGMDWLNQLALVTGADIIIRRDLVEEL
jgi:hypothetical protein